MSTTTKPREVPILFRDEMVRAILAGRKTQTRRVIRFVAHNPPGMNLLASSVSLGHYCTGVPESGTVLYSRRGDGVWEQRTKPVHPRWRVGDLLWVREAFASRESGSWLPCAIGDCHVATFRADDPLRDSRLDVRGYSYRPSIHLPRRLSRLVLRVTAVRAERVNAITKADAQAEGVEPLGWPYRDEFERLWNSMHGAGSFASGAWVWVVTFERAEAARG